MGQNQFFWYTYVFHPSRAKFFGRVNGAVLVSLFLVQWFPRFLWFQWFFSIVLLVLPVFLLNPFVFLIIVVIVVPVFFEDPVVLVG